MAEQDKPDTTQERAAWEGEPVTPAQSPAEGPATPEKKPVTAVEGPSWEREVLTKVAMAAIEEQRRARRWSIFFKILIFVYLFGVFFMFKSAQWQDASLVDGKHTALVEIVGVIADDAEASADNVIAGLRAAYKSKGTSGIILRINSPGGSPVQAGYINDEIRRLRNEHPNIPVYAVVTDICASGGYYVAVAADKIYVDKASIVGSIGVRMSGLTTFGFTEAMKKLGIERRMMTAGEDKGSLDPFSPLKPGEVEHIKTLLNSIHQQFINTVKQGRGNRLKEDAKLFSGAFWTGEQSLALGLADDFGSTSQVARDIIGAEKIVDYTRQPAPFERLIDRLGVATAKTLVAITESRQASAMELR